MLQMYWEGAQKLMCRSRVPGYGVMSFLMIERHAQDPHRAPRALRRLWSFALASWKCGAREPLGALTVGLSTNLPFRVVVARLVKVIRKSDAANC